MKVKLWGTRGSLAGGGEDTAKYGGNTACVEVEDEKGHLLILDAGSGIHKLGDHIKNNNTKVKRIDILLTHLHLDHILGLGFFKPLYDPEMEVHIYAPISHVTSLYLQLSHYLSPPFFPVYLRDLPCQLYLHEVANETFCTGSFNIYCDLVCHPGLTVGYRVQSTHAIVAYLPDHEPALGVPSFPLSADWTSGYTIAENADLLIHDCQYENNEYEEHAGWGHSSIRQAFQFAQLTRVKRFAPFHHDPSHTDKIIDRMLAQEIAAQKPVFEVCSAHESAVIYL